LLRRGGQGPNWAVEPYDDDDDGGGGGGGGVKIIANKIQKIHNEKFLICTARLILLG
jgi:hypothetical protein